MANTFLTADLIAKEAIARLQNNLVLANLVHRDAEDTFAKKGDTIQVKKPATFTAAEFNGTTSDQNITEDKVLVTMDKIADVTVSVTSKELSLNIEDFGKQVVEGAVQAISQKIDSDIAALALEIINASGNPAYNLASMSDIALARKVLNDQKAPLSNRRLVIDPEAEANLLVLDAVINAEKSGTTDALREATLGRLLGFDTYMSQNIGSDVEKGVLNMAFHKDALAFVSRKLELPLGGANGQHMSYNGFTIRVTMGYDMATKTNKISFDVLYGVKVLNQDLICRALGQA